MGGKLDADDSLSGVGEPLEVVVTIVDGGPHHRAIR